MTPMSTSDARKRLTESIIRLDQRELHREWLRAMDETYPPTEPRDQETGMTSPTQRRHDELVALLTEIRDALEPDYVIEARTCRKTKTEPADVTEDPHKVHDHSIDPSCREHVGNDGLLRGECIDVTMEPPVGSRVVDCDGDVWERREDGDWDALTLNDEEMWGMSWEWLRRQGPLRLATPADLARVGIEDEPAPADDPDEALRTALNREIVRQSISGEVEIKVYNGYGLEAGLARVAREHIEAEWKPYILREQAAREKAQDRAEQAEADVERHSKSADKWCNPYADKCEEVERLSGWKARHEALRDDLMGIDWPPAPRLVVSEALARDDERAKGEQR